MTHRHPTAAEVNAAIDKLGAEAVRVVRERDEARARILELEEELQEKRATISRLRETLAHHGIGLVLP